MPAPQEYLNALKRIAAREHKVSYKEDQIIGDHHGLVGQTTIPVSGLRCDSHDKDGNRVDGNLKRKIHDLLDASKQKGDLLEKLVETSKKGDKKVYFTVATGTVIIVAGLFLERRKGWKDIRLLEKFIQRHNPNVKKP